MAKNDQSKKHQVLKRIKYKSGLEGETYIDPDPSRDWAADGPTFDHLSSGDYQLLIVKRIIAVAGSK